jgi:hypothetical protein
MNHKLKGNKIIHGDIISPETEIATFNSSFGKKYQKQIVSALNHGHDMLMLYQTYRDNMRIANVVEFLDKAEKIFQKYDEEIYNSMRKDN